MKRNNKNSRRNITQGVLPEEKDSENLTLPECTRSIGKLLNGLALMLEKKEMRDFVNCQILMGRGALGLMLN